MVLKDFLMVAAITARSKWYLQKLLDADLLPAFVLIMEKGADVNTPGRRTIDTLKCLQSALSERNIPFETLSVSTANDAVVLDKIKTLPQKYLIYSGYGGTILKKDYFHMGKEILHVHAGKLPEYRGSTTVYYQILAEDCCTATAIFLREKIDVGPVLHAKDFSHPELVGDVDYEYDSKIRAEVLVETIQGYLKTGHFNQLPQSREGAEDYYIIHPVLKHLALLKCSLAAKENS